MKTYKLITLAIAGATFWASCSESTENKMENTADSLSAKMERSMDNIRESDDEDFLDDAVEANTMELKTLMLGQQKGGKDVKGHASHMIADHKKLGDDVWAYIAKKNIRLNDLDTAGTDNDLSNKAPGRDFDKAFADKMVRDHEKVIDLFEEGMNEVKDPELKDLISKALPTLRSHLEMSREMQSKFK